MFVNHSEAVEAVIAYYTKIVMEYITLTVWNIRNLRVDYHFACSINKLNPAVIINSSKSVGEYPGMIILRLNDWLTRKLIEITSFFTIAITYK